MSELPLTLMQVYRRYENFGQNVLQNPAPANVAEFISLSSTILKGITIEAAGAAQVRSSAAVYSNVLPLVQTLNGISLVSSIFADVTKFAVAIDSGNQAAIDEAGLKLILAATGALLATAYLMAVGTPLISIMGPAALGYLAGS